MPKPGTTPSKNGTHATGLPVGGNGVALHERDNRERRDRRVLERCVGVVGDVARFFSDYIVLPESSILVSSLWVVAAHTPETFDRLVLRTNFRDWYWTRRMRTALPHG
jgi:hypothetical protein